MPKVSRPETRTILEDGAYALADEHVAASVSHLDLWHKTGNYASITPIFDLLFGTAE